MLADVERDGAEDLAEVTGATLCEHLDDLTGESLGSLDRFSVETLEGDEGRRERLIFEHANSRLACIDVGGSAGTATEEVIRGLFDALRSVIGAMDSGRLLLVEAAFTSPPLPRCVKRLRPRQAAQARHGCVRTSA